MNSIQQLQHAFTNYLQTTFTLDKEIINQGTFTLNVDPNKQQFGHINTNAALTLAKKLGKNPQVIAQQILQEFKHHSIEKAEIAGAGFINFFLTTHTFQGLAQELLAQQEQFFKLEKDTPRHTYNIEFVSANPTGPLHLGHGRGGIIGDVLANIVSFLGHHTTREFYINDAGAQIQKLGMSFKIRCLQALGQNVTLPEDSYHGEYLVELAQQCLQELGPIVQEKPDEFFADYAKKHMLELIKKTLQEYGISYDVWFSEKTLHTSGAIATTIKELQAKGFLYEKDGALWFKSTEFGDDKDRVVKKSDGEMTYVAADIAYMKNKITRGADRLIMVLGHDHHGYVMRLQGILKALDLGPATLEAILYQLVKMKASGQLVRMSKRAGNIVTLADVIETVGKDVARFFYLNRKADAQLEFDLDLALKHTEENPVYYVQYAYVRTNSILKKAAEVSAFHEIGKKDSNKLGPEEAWLLLKITALKQLLESISSNHQTHLLTYYILELAQQFHAYYGKHRIVVLEDVEQSRSRLLLVTLVRNTLATALTLLGISKPEKM